MASSLERPPEKKNETVPVATPESPVEVASEMTREGVEGGIGVIHETARQAVDELEGVVKDLVGIVEEKPEKRLENK